VVDVKHTISIACRVVSAENAPKAVTMQNAEPQAKSYFAHVFSDSLNPLHRHRNFDCR
jgi:hypothetical protein